MVDANDLQLFLDLLRSGRIITVAKLRQLDHATVSRRVVRLEQALGARLFDRSPAGWTPTAAGLQLARKAELVESLLGEVIEDFRPSDEELTGTVRVVAPDGFATYAITPRIESLRRRNPALKIELETSTSRSVAQLQTFDVAVTAEPPQQRGAHIYELCTYELKTFSSEKYLSNSGRPVETLEQLSGHSLIGYIDALMELESLKVLREITGSESIMIRTNNITAQVQAVRNGLGIALLPAYIVEDVPDLVPVLPEAIAVPRSYWITVPNQLARVPRVQAVVSLLRDVVRQHPALSLSSELG